MQSREDSIPQQTSRGATSASLISTGSRHYGGYLISDALTTDPLLTGTIVIEKATDGLNFVEISRATVSGGHAPAKGSTGIRVEVDGKSAYRMRVVWNRNCDFKGEHEMSTVALA